MDINGHPNTTPKTLTKKEVANAFKISVKTLSRRLKKVGVAVSTEKNLYPEQLQLLFATFGNPQE